MWRDILTAVTLFTPDTLPGEGLSTLRWEARPVLVFAADDDPRLAEQLRLFEEAGAAMAERRMTVIVDTGPGSALRTRFGPDGFTIILLGLDGGEKFRAAEITPPGALTDLIDTMPMRRQEMRGGG